MTDRDSPGLRSRVTFRTHQGGRPHVSGPKLVDYPIQASRKDHLKMGAMPRNGMRGKGGSRKNPMSSGPSQTIVRSRKPSS